MTHWSYLPFLLVWALPVIVVQWLVGGRHLWRFDTTSLVGLWIGPVPIEEILFYLLTAIMIVQGFVITWRRRS